MPFLACSTLITIIVYNLVINPNQIHPEYVNSTSAENGKESDNEEDEFYISSEVTPTDNGMYQCPACDYSSDKCRNLARHMDLSHSSHCGECGNPDIDHNHVCQPDDENGEQT